MQPPVASSQFPAKLNIPGQDYGRVAYEAFCESAKAYAPSIGMPRWNEEKFPETVKKAWTAAALAARALK